MSIVYWYDSGAQIGLPIHIVNIYRLFHPVVHIQTFQTQLGWYFPMGGKNSSVTLNFRGKTMFL